MCKEKKIIIEEEHKRIEKEMEKKMVIEWGRAMFGRKRYTNERIKEL